MIKNFNFLNNVNANLEENIIFQSKENIKAKNINDELAIEESESDTNQKENVKNNEIQNIIENALNSQRYSNIVSKNKKKLGRNEKLNIETKDMILTVKQIKDSENMNFHTVQNIRNSKVRFNNDRIRREMTIENVSDMKNYNNESFILMKPVKILNSTIIYCNNLGLFCENTHSCFPFYCELYSDFIIMYKESNLNFMCVNNNKNSCIKKVKESRDLHLLINLNNCFIKKEGFVSINNSKHFIFSLINGYEKQYFCFKLNDNSSQKSNWYHEIKQRLNINKFNEEYIKHDLLGKGKFSCVYKSNVVSSNLQSYYKIENDDFIALKLIKKSQMTKMDLKCCRNEVNILTIINHKNIIKLNSFVENDQNIFINLEYFKGLTLYEYFKSKNYDLNENQVKIIVKKLAEVIIYLHENLIVHRDLKPENILIKEISALSLKSKVNNDKKDVKDNKNYNIMPVNIIEKRNRSPNIGIDFNNAINIKNETKDIKKFREIKVIQYEKRNFKNSKSSDNISQKSSDIKKNKYDPKLRISPSPNLNLNNPKDLKKSHHNHKKFDVDIKLIDFGLARFLGVNEYIVNEPYGTLVSFLN